MDVESKWFAFLTCELDRCSSSSTWTLNLSCRDLFFKIFFIAWFLACCFGGLLLSFRWSCRKLLLVSLCSGLAGGSVDTRTFLHRVWLPVLQEVFCVTRLLFTCANDLHYPAIQYGLLFYNQTDGIYSTEKPIIRLVLTFLWQLFQICTKTPFSLNQDNL